MPGVKHQRRTPITCRISWCRRASELRPVPGAWLEHLPGHDDRHLRQRGI